MSSNVGTRPIRALLHSFWMENRRGWIALGAGGLLCALGFRLVDPARHLRETLDALGGVSMGLAIFVTFILATISESNRWLPPWPARIRRVRSSRRWRANAKRNCERLWVVCAGHIARP